MASKKLRNSARGEDCTLQIFPYCNENPETTVLCHVGSQSKGMGQKSEDFHAVYGCSTCHDIIDGRRKADLTEAEILQCIIWALHRTHLRMIDLNLLKYL